MSLGAFATIAGLAFPVTRTGVTEAPDGAFGKRRWTLPVPRLDDQTLEPALRALIGTPSAAESTRAADGTLQTTQPLVTVTGELTGGVTVWCEVRTTAATPVYVVRSGLPTTRRALTLQLREG